MITDQRLCQLCSETYDGKPMTFETAGVHFRITVEDGFNVIAFKGSDNVDDWLRDFEIGLVNVAKLGQLQAGFQFDAAQAWARIPDDNVILTGHSKGGADAQIIAGMLAAAGLPPLKLTTFGAPRVCWTESDAIIDLLANVPGSDYRNANDPVPLLPWFLFAARPVVQLGVGHVAIADIDRADHHIEGYMASLAEISVRNKE